MTGQGFKQYRERELNLSRGELALILKVNVKTVRNWEETSEIPVVLELALPELTRRMRRFPQSEAV